MSFGLLRILPPSLWELAWALLRLPGSGTKGRERVQHALNAVIARAEQVGLVRRVAGIDRALTGYPELRALERGFATIREECEAVLALRSRMPDLRELGGAYTDTPLNRIRWKALMFTSCGVAVPENRTLCPQTSALLDTIPGVYNAFFSVLEAGQHIAPHFGYYKGLARYHLGVVIPEDNVGGKCWLRLNADPIDNASRDKRLIERGETYFWRNGEGVLFDDTYLHEAHNASGSVRVVLFVDLLRKLPAPLALWNRACLAAAYRCEPAMRNMARVAALRSANAKREQPALSSPP